MALRRRRKLAAELERLHIVVAAQPETCQLSFQIITSFLDISHHAIRYTKYFRYNSQQPGCSLTAAKMKPPTADEKRKIATTFLGHEAARDPEKYESYFNYYEECFVRLPGNWFAQNDRPAYSSHDEVVSSFECLVARIEQTNADFRNTVGEGVSYAAYTRAVRALLRASLMVDNYEYNFPAYRIRDFVPQTWKEHQPFVGFITGCFPSPAQPPKICEAVRSALEHRKKFTAWQLEERYKVRLQPTNNLAEHLVFDEEPRILYVFSHVNFVRAHLERSINEPIDIDFNESLQK